MNRRDFRERMAPSMLVGLSPGRCRSTALPVSRTELDYFLQPSRFVPTDGIVKQTALKATAGATTDIQKARAIYQRVAKIPSAIRKSAAVDVATSDSCWSQVLQGLTIGKIPAEHSTGDDGTVATASGRSQEPLKPSSEFVLPVRSSGGD